MKNCKLRRFIIFAIILAFVTGCNKEKGYELCAESESYDYEPATANADGEMQSYSKGSSDYRSCDSISSNSQSSSRKIVRTGELSLECEDMKEAKHFIDSLTKTAGGYYTSEYSVKRKHSTTTDLEIRIPSSHFDLFLSSLEGENKNIKIERKHIFSEDKTKEYYDSESRKKTKDAIAEQYRQLLKKCNSISDILEVKRRLDIIQEEADLEARRMQAIDQDVNYSKISIRLTKTEECDVDDDDSLSIKNSFGYGASIAKYIFHGIIILWPIWIILAVFIYLWKRRKKQNKKAAKNNEQ